MKSFMLDQRLRSAIAATVTFSLFLFVAAISIRAPAQPAAQAQPPITIIATPEPTPIVAEVGLPHAIVAYDSPGGAVIGPIEAGRGYLAVARYGTDWVQLDVDGSGLIWTEAAPIGLELAGLTDRMPPPPPPAPIVVYVPAPVEPQQQPAILEAAPTEPPAPSEPNFAASFQEPGCSKFVGYLPGDPCYVPPTGRQTVDGHEVIIITATTQATR
jgi:hypothetical protein